ncbi:MAG: biotin/lipoyl-containing protein [Candidatus Muiribacteriota bacterium]
MKYKLLIDGKDKFKLEHEDNINVEYVNNISVDGKEHVVEFVNFNSKGEIESLFIDNTFYDVEVEKGSDGLPENIILNGQKYPIEFLRVGHDRFLVKQDKKEKSGKIVALIPGKVINIAVKPGDEVKEGDIVLILEAMKMENEIISPKDGVVRHIEVSEGQNVEKNQPMIVID